MEGNQDTQRLNNLPSKGQPEGLEPREFFLQGMCFSAPSKLSVTVIKKQKLETYGRQNETPGGKEPTHLFVDAELELTDQMRSGIFYKCE